MSNSLQLHGLQHSRLPCLLPSPGVCSNSCSLSQWCYLTISSATLFSLWLQSFPETGSFTVSQFFASCCQNTGASTSASVLPMNIQGWFPLGLTDLILQSKILSRVFPSTVWKHQFFSAQPSFGEGNGNPLQYSCLENPMDRVAWRVTNRVAKSSWGRKELDTTEAT